MGLIGAVYFGVLTGAVQTAPAEGPTTRTIIPRVAISGKWCLVSISHSACRRRGLHRLASGRGLRSAQIKIVEIQVIFDHSVRPDAATSLRKAK